MDFDVLDFARLLSRLPAHLPISDDYDGFVDGEYRYSKPWYASQRQHMVAWFRGQATTGAGAYTRNTPNHSARRAYNRLLDAGSLLWINEALGQDPDLVRRAAEAAALEREYRKRCRIVREHLPWDQVARLAEARSTLGGRIRALGKQFRR